MEDNIVNQMATLQKQRQEDASYHLQCCLSYLTFSLCKYFLCLVTQSLTIYLPMLPLSSLMRDYCTTQINIISQALCKKVHFPEIRYYRQTRHYLTTLVELEVDTSDCSCKQSNVLKVLQSQSTKAVQETQPVNGFKVIFAH